MEANDASILLANSLLDEMNSALLKSLNNNSVANTK